MTTRSVRRRYSFPWLARGRARAAWSVLLIASLACNLPFVDTGTDEAISLEMEAHAIRLQPNEITYSITLINHALNDVGAVELEVAVAEGGSVHEILSIPRGAEVAQTHSAVTWRLDSMPLESIVGVFSFRVALDGPAQPVQATVRWKNPSPGEKLSVIEAVEEAALSDAAASMSALPLTQMPGTGMVLFGQGRRSLIPFGGAPTQGGAPAPLLTEIPGTGIRYFVPQGDRGQVTLARLDSDPQPGIGQDLTWLATYQVTKEQPGSAIVVVPLRQPAPPFSVVRVFVDSGEGYIEQDVMGSVTQDGLHAAFAADGASAYALGVDTGHMNSGTSRDFMFRDGVLQNMDMTEGVAEAVAESLNDLAGIMAFEETINALLIGQTGSILQTSQGDEVFQTDSDGDGLTNHEEDILGTDSNNWDTDGDLLDDGYEISYFGSNPLSDDTDGDGSNDSEEFLDGTDPRDADSDEDSISDGAEDLAGTNPNSSDTDGDGATDAQELRAGTDPNDDESTPSAADFAPVPGCGEQTCFSTGGDELYGLGDSLLPDSMQDFLGMQDLAVASPDIPETSNVQQVQGPSGGPALDARDLRAVIGVIENGILMVIPGGQRVQVVFGPTAVSGSQPTQDTSTGTPTPGPTVAVTPTNSPVFIPPPPTDTFTPEAPQDNEGPAIKGVSASPDPIYAGAPKGCTPTSSGVTAAISDPSGVASATVIFVGTSAGSVPMTHSGGTNWQAKLGPFDAPGAVNYQIRAFDSLGNRSDTGFATLTVNACIP